MTREERRQARYAKYFGDIVPRERRERCARCTEDEYIEMHIERPRCRQRDADGIQIPRREVKKALAEIRADVGLPDFRHKIWKGVKA